MDMSERTNLHTLRKIFTLDQWGVVQNQKDWFERWIRSKLLVWREAPSTASSDFKSDQVGQSCNFCDCSVSVFVDKELCSYHAAEHKFSVSFP